MVPELVWLFSSLSRSDVEWRETATLTASFSSPGSGTRATFKAQKRAFP